MNRVYHVVWNRSKGVWQAASELSQSSRSSSSGAVSVAGALKTISAGALLLIALPLHASNLPSGGTVVGGQGSINSSDKTLTVNQKSQNMAIDWQDFSIAEGHTVNFNQPNAQAAALNRVTGNNVSEIRGALNANGRVFLVNPNGVMFSSTARVDVGALVTSTLDISTEDFMAGNYHFEGASANAIVNRGNITTAEGGVVAMIAAEIINTGSINTPQGSTLMGAGSKVTLDLGGPVKIEVEEALLDTYIEQGGAIRADGGLVYLTAKAAGNLASSVINHTGVTEARTLATGEDGRIMLMGDMDSGQVQVAGTLDASAPNGGDGGFIETSGAKVRVASGTSVTTLADSGQTGEWLIDPTDFTVSTGDAVEAGSGIGADTLSNSLASTSFYLETAGTDTGSEAGDINIESAISWDANTYLELRAHGDININAPITATGESAALYLNYGGFYQNAGTVADGTNYHIQAPITLSGSNASLAINGQAYTLIHSMTELDNIDITGLNGHYALAKNLNASSTTYSQALVGDRYSQFDGTFAGLGNTITNLTINSGNSSTGLFSYINTGGVVRDVGLIGGSVTSDSLNLGGLAGRNDGVILNAYNTGAVASDNNYVGGLVGYNHGSITNAYATGTVASGKLIVGGLVGYNNGSITNAYATGSVSGESGYVGGLVGQNYYGNIDNAYATGTVSGNGNHIGGLAGYSLGNITNAYATGDVSGNSRVGGLVGSLYGSNSSITNSYATGRVTGDSELGGLVGYSSVSGANDTNSFYATTDADGNAINQTNDSGLGKGKTWAELMGLHTGGGNTGGGNTSGNDTRVDNTDRANRASRVIAALQQSTPRMTSGSRPGADVGTNVFSAMPSQENRQLSGGLELVETDGATMTAQASNRNQLGPLALFVVEGGMRLNDSNNSTEQ
ncbi:GLUG motif-containing protein [Vreelandella arcis]|uniref:Filamentous hemagglutinin family N-terminal domain-containing protein n=1 Tax=Vreelandella arcis TaxID=416873 RepID=A0A1H0CHF0_9GAMM|nr:GLUG motif-containing protein [Halomonas arcis]SDN57290.1 filamentous hemagglutinin family N-terminal domain-containing protein [Halomonas arcis]